MSEPPSTNAATSPAPDSSPPGPAASTQAESPAPDSSPAAPVASTQAQKWERVATIAVGVVGIIVGIWGGTSSYRSTELAEAANRNGRAANEIAREASQHVKDIDTRQQTTERFRRAENVVITTDPLRAGETTFTVVISNFNPYPISGVSAVLGYGVKGEPQVKYQTLPGCHSITATLVVDRPLLASGYSTWAQSSFLAFTDDTGQRWVRVASSPPIPVIADYPHGIPWMPGMFRPTDAQKVSFETSTEPLPNVTCTPK